MKKILIFAVFMGSILGMNAQIAKTRVSIPNEVLSMPVQEKMIENSAVLKMETPSFINNASMLTNVPIFKNKRHKDGDYTDFGWILSTEYAATVIGSSYCTWGGGNPFSNTFMLFPDSLGISYLAYTDYPSASFNRTYYPAMGFTFDPYSKTYDDNFIKRLFANEDNEICGYRIDSLVVFGDYRIAEYNENSPDTLRVFITSHNAYNALNYINDSMIGIEYFRLRWANFGDDGIRFVAPIVEYDDITNIPQKGSVVKPAAKNLVTIDYILSPADSVQWQPGYIYARPMRIPVDYEVPVGSVTSIVMKFIPGYDYTNADTIQKMYYNSSAQTFVGGEVRKNALSLNTIDIQDFEYFCDWGEGFNCRLVEDMSLRYNTNTFYNDPSYNPNNLSAYLPHYIPIPYVAIAVSTKEDWWSTTVTYTIEGNVSYEGNPLAGVMITGTNGKSTTTDINGDYTLMVNGGQTVTITPSLPRYKFMPASITCSDIISDISNQDFIAIDIPTYTIQGQVSHDGNSLSGVTITCTNGSSAITDVNGEYTITVDENETVTLTPSLSGYRFTPPSITRSNITANLTNLDFVATKTYAIQGQVTQNGNPLSGVTITCTNGTSAITNANGQYTIMVDENETGTLTPSLSGYSFTPQFLTFEDVSTDIPDQDFIATRMYTVQGQVTFNGNPFSGVTIMCTNETSVVTDANGQYIISLASLSTETLTPELDGYNFYPIYVTYDNISTNFTNQNFTASVAGSGISDRTTMQASINIYPNPTTNQLQVKSNDMTIDKLDIMDVTGRFVKTYHFNCPINTTLDVSELQNGMYFMTFYSQGQKIMKKLVKCDF